MNVMTPLLPPGEIVNILNDQVNYIYNSNINTVTDSAFIPVINQHAATIIELEEDPIVFSQTFTPGQFIYIKNNFIREMLQNGWAAIEELELWEFMKLDSECYMRTSLPEVFKISKKMEELGYNGHSGASFGWTMRQLQYIAQNGELMFRTMCIISAE